MSRGTSASIRGKKSGPPKLRIVLIGGRHAGAVSGKSLVGNIILGRHVFKTNRRTSKSVMRQELVSGRKITVVDTPGWISHYPLDLTPSLTQLEIQQSVYLCPPAPNVFVLVMRLDIPYVGTGMSAEEHMRFLFSDRVWRHTIVVFTVADKNNMRPDLISSSCELRYLTEKCEGRFHVLNISDRGDGSQVTELLEKIEQMVASNRCLYKTEKQVSEELKKKKRTIRRRAEQRRAHKQTRRIPKHIGLTDLRVLLLGRRWSGKSSAGNIILRGNVFQTEQRSVQSEVRHGEVAGRHVTVVDSPGWYYNSPLQDTSEMDKLEIQYSVCLCPPGPHAVLLIVPLYAAFTKAQRVAVEEHMTLLTQKVWSHTIVLFTYGDQLGDTSIEQHIEAEGEDLRWLVDTCGNRYHVFNNKNRDTQVTELLEKIEEMVSGNRGGHYEFDGDVCAKISERKRNIEGHVLKEASPLNTREHLRLPDVRLMLVGGEQEQRSRAGGIILQQDVFRRTPLKEFKTQSKMTVCVKQQRQVARRNVTVVNCPDWSTTPPPEIKDVLLHGVALCSPGAHAVLLTVDVRSSFSEADRRSVKELMELLGDRVWTHTLVLFTWGQWLGERCVEEYIESEGEPLRWLLEKCRYRYHVLDCFKWDISEVTELMEKIEDVVMMNQLSGETSSETGSLYRWSPHKKVSDWLRNKHPRPIASTSGYGTMSEVLTQTDTVISDLSIKSSSEEEEVEEEDDSEALIEMMKMMKIESGDKELKKPADNDEVYLRSCCEKCQHVQQSYGKKITPKKLSRGCLQAQLEGEGTFECALTGLIFEATKRVLVGYSILSWSTLSKFVQNPWMIAGPIFNVQTVNKDASALKSIQLPHSLCLTGQEEEKVFGVLHVTGKNPVIERVQYSGSHLKWPVSSLSPVGAIALDAQQGKHHGAVLVYEDLGSSIDTHCFRIYLSSCNSSDIKDIKKKVKKGRFNRVDKNPLCLLVDGEYNLMSEPRGEIHPEYLPFTLAPTPIRGFFEAYYEQPPPFTFNLKVSGTDVTAWNAIIRQGDLVVVTELKPSKLQVLGRTQPGPSKRKMYISDTPGEAITSKRQFLLNEPGVKEPQISQTTDMKADFVEKNRSALVQRVTEVLSIADDLLQKRIFANETYSKIKEAKTSAEQMRILLDVTCKKGKRAMSAFYDSLQQHESFLLEDMEEDQGT